MFIIDVLYIKDCKGKDEALSNLNIALSLLNFKENEYFVNVKEIKKEKEAKLWKLAGSPTVKVNGVDVEFGPKFYGLFPREYDNGGIAPDVETMMKALQMDLRERAKLISSEFNETGKTEKNVVQAALA